jgi:LacI family transcriptional regulator
MNDRLTKIVGMIIPDSGNGFFVDLAQHFQRELSHERCAVVVMSSDGSGKREATHITLLEEMDVSGVVFIGSQFNMHNYARLAALQRPILVLDREIPLNKGADFVMLDNEAGIRMGVRHLVDLGHRHIAHIEGSQRTEPGQIRRAAFVEACSLLKIQGTALPGDFSFAAGRRGASMIMELDEDVRPTAIVAGNDLAAIGAIQTLSEAGVDVPTEMSVVGFDDIEIASWIHPALTTIRQDREALAHVGAKLLSARMARASIFGGSGAACRSEYVSPNLIERASTAPPRTR